MISREEVLKLAKLARLKIGEMEIPSLQKDISNILEYVAAVSVVEIPLSSDEQCGQINNNVMREDMPRNADDALTGKEAALRAAFPARDGDYNVVRKIIQKDE